MSTWIFEPGHTEVEFRARHMTVTWVRGLFKDVHGRMELESGVAREEGSTSGRAIARRAEAAYDKGSTGAATTRTGIGGTARIRTFDRDAATRW